MNSPYSVVLSILSQIPTEDLEAELQRRKDPWLDKIPACAHLSVRTVLLAVATAWEVPVCRLWEPNRKTATVYPRRAAMALLQSEAGLSSTGAAAVFGMDHANALIARRQVSSGAKLPRDFSNRLGFALSLINSKSIS
jgi:chromosomal replication initiation ATPase DnaA